MGPEPSAVVEPVMIVLADKLLACARELISPGESVPTLRGTSATEGVTYAEPFFVPGSNAGRGTCEATPVPSTEGARFAALQAATAAPPVSSEL